ncbi:MAG: Phenylalanine--tRNA ligase beta subunit [Candidatus Anoxychlamydiales bacterium]|nr:Phenylalanine--tRNA ligase beta subunit [Candidatus Anoxychlamydiales bacterium]
MKFKIDQSVANLFPSIKVGILSAEGIENSTTDTDISLLLDEEQENCKSQFISEQISSIPKIRDWREAYRKFGFKPSSYRSSIEALIRRVLKGKNLPSINPIVDLYNLISIKYLIPIGADDLDKIEGIINLTIAEGNETFLKLGSDVPETAQKGEVIYRDDKEVLCRCWNYRECEKSKITEATKNVCLVFEGLESTAKEEILKSISDLKELISKYCRGGFKEYYLDKSTLEAISK